jgi:hypothetical protein
MCPATQSARPTMTPVRPSLLVSRSSPGFCAFFSHLALTALVLATFAMSAAAFLAGGNLSTCARIGPIAGSLRLSRWVWRALMCPRGLTATSCARSHPRHHGIYRVIGHLPRIACQHAPMGLAFRSWAGVLPAATVILLLPARINPQQALLRTQFGAGVRRLRRPHITDASFEPQCLPGNSGMNPSRLGIFTCGSVLASITSLSPMMPLSRRMYAVTA